MAVALLANADNIQDVLSEEKGANSVVATTVSENRKERVEALMMLLHRANNDKEEIDSLVVENAIRALEKIDLSGSARALLKLYVEDAGKPVQTRCLALHAMAQSIQRLHGSEAMIDALRVYLESDAPLVTLESRLIIASDRSAMAESVLFDLMDKHYALLPPSDFTVTEENGREVEVLFMNVFADFQALKHLGTERALAKFHDRLEALRRRYPSEPGHKLVQCLEAEGIPLSAPSK